MNIREALKQGISAEELQEQFKQEVNKVKAEMDKEEKAATAHKAIRTNLVNALVDYMVSLGYMDAEEATDKTKANLNKALEQNEKEGLLYKYCKSNIPFSVKDLIDILFI
jgi:hypothetical protein